MGAELKAAELQQALAQQPEPVHPPQVPLLARQLCQMW